jgi:hypothetical protein
LEVEANENVVILSWSANLFCVVQIMMFGGYARMPELMQEHDAKKIGTKPTAFVRHV